MAKKRENSEKIPWVKITLTPEERLKLRGEPPELTKLYLIISERRDFETNIAGIKTRISDRTFKEGMEITRKQGRQKRVPKTSLIQRWLGQLEALGLIRQCGKYVFDCPLAYVDESAQKRCDQTATTSATRSATNQDVNETLINTGVLTDSESEVRPEVLPQVRPHLYIPLRSTVTTLYSSGENENFENDIPDSSILKPYKELISKQGFGFGQILNKDTIAMISSWIHAFVTIEEAKIGIESSNAKFKTGRPHSPLYYFKPVLEVKESFKKAGNLAKETVNAKHQPTKTNQQRHKSVTQGFWDDTTAALERHYADHQSED